MELNGKQITVESMTSQSKKSTTPSESSCQEKTGDDRLQKLQGLGVRTKFYGGEELKWIMEQPNGNGGTIGATLDALSLEECVQMAMAQRKGVAEGRYKTTLADELMKDMSARKWERLQHIAKANAEESKEKLSEYWRKVKAYDAKMAEREAEEAQALQERGNVRKALQSAYTYAVAKTGHATKVGKLLEAETDALVAWICDRPKEGLIMTGKCGTGKTTWMRAVVSVLRSQGHSVYCTTADDIAAGMKDDVNAMTYWWNTEFIAIDDIGTEPATVKCFGTDYQPIAQLVMHRYSNCQPMIITTNIGDSLAETYGERIASRITERCEKIKFNPAKKSYRK